MTAHAKNMMFSAARAFSMLNLLLLERKEVSLADDKNEVASKSLRIYNSEIKVNDSIVLDYDSKKDELVVIKK